MADKKKKSCKIIAISSIKGGVGKTTTTANLGCIMARRFNKHTLVLDANLSAPNLGLHFGYVDIDITVHDVLGKRKKYSEAIYEYNKGLHVMPGSLKGKFLEKWSFGSLISKIEKDYDVILIDTSPSVNELDKVIDSLDGIVFVATPDYPTLSTTLQIAEHLEGKVSVAGIILNMVKNKKFELKKEDFEFTTDIGVLGVVPYDLAIQEAIANVSPLGFSSMDHRVSKIYMGIARKLLDEGDVDGKKNFLGKIKFFLKSKI